MQRRKFIASVGSLAAAGAAAMGTGAFTSVSANRTVSVEVADDANAFLAIEPEDNSPNASQYVGTTGNAVSLDFTGDDDSSTDIGSGINDNATTTIDDLLKISNQGTQGVYVGYGGDGSGTTLTNANFALYHEDSDYDGAQTQYDPSNGNYNNDGQLNIDTAPDENGDGEPDLVYLNPGETLNNVGAFFFGSPDVSTITSTPVTFQAAASFSDL